MDKGVKEKGVSQSLKNMCITENRKGGGCELRKGKRKGYLRQERGKERGGGVKTKGGGVEK